MRNKLTTTCLFGSLLLSFICCSKKETLSVDNETQSVVDNAIADQEYMSMIPASQQHASNTRGLARETASPCDTLTHLSGDTLWSSAAHVDPTYTMNVSNSACNLTLPDGKARSGKLWIRMNNRIKVTGAKMIIKLNEYKTGNTSYSCDSIVLTTISSGTLYSEFNVKLVNGVVTTSNGTIKYSFDRTIRNYFGTNAFTSVYGTSHGVNTQGRVFTGNIPATTPLIKHRNCQYIDKGVQELIPEGYKARVVDFGNGTCDDEATFSVNNNTITFKLK